MTATDQTFSGTPAQLRPMAPAGFATAMPLVMRFEPNWRVRTLLFRILGAAMVLGSTGLWLLPGAAADPELALVKIGISVVFLFAGLVLMTVHDPQNLPEARIDPVRRELRVLQKDNRGTPKTVLRRSFDSLGGARLTADTLQLLEADGSLLIELPVASAAARRMLRDQLSGIVPIMS